MFEIKTFLEDSFEIDQAKNFRQGFLINMWYVGLIDAVF